MNLKITTAVDLSIGGAQVANLYGTITPYPKETEAGGLTVPCDVKFWIDAAANTANKDLVIPEVGGVKIVSTTLDIDPSTAAGAALPLAFYNAAAAKLSADYGITVIVE